MRLIDADALRESALTATDMSDLAFDYCFPHWQVSKCIREAPTIDPVRHGRWVHYPNNNSHVVEVDMCSECKNEYVFGDVYNYCPNCGTKMDGAT